MKKHGSYGRLLELFELGAQLEKITQISKLEKTYPHIPVKALMEEYDTLLSSLTSSCPSIRVISYLDVVAFHYFEIREGSNLRSVLLTELSILNQAIRAVLTQQKENPNLSVSLIDAFNKELEARRQAQAAEEQKRLDDTSKFNSPAENSVDSEENASEASIQYRPSMS